MRKPLSIGAKILIPTMIMLTLLIVVVLYFVSNALRNNTIDTATMDAKSTLKQVTLQRELYTKSVVAKLNNLTKTAEFSANHSSSDTAFPPPATFLLELSEMLSKENGVKFELYSPYPFNNRSERKLTQSQREAWSFFKSNPEEKYFVSTNTVDGKEVLRVHQGDYMVSDGCTSCHNKHDDSIKKDWKVGDLRGVLEVTSPIEPQLAQGRERLMGLTAIFILAGLVISTILFYLIRRVTASLKQAVEMAGELHHGNLTIKGRVGEQDEAGKVTMAMNSVAASLHQSMTEVAESSSNLTSGTQHITTASKRITDGSSQQNASLSQVSSIMQEVEYITLENEEHTQDAEKLSLQAHKKAEQATQQMTVMLQAMEEINDSSSSISGIITTIDEIAFQTNILSINASVEAAHAGEHGKGFAIVATEVRSLALRSAEAARETTELIDTTAQKVAAGSEITHKTAAMLDDIMESSLKVVSLMKEISQATSIQAAEVRNVSSQISDLEALSENNLNNSGETATACEQLAAEAESLLNIVSRFKLEGR